MRYTTRIILTALLGLAVGFLLRRPGIGALVGSIVGAMVPVERYLANPLSYLFVGALLFATLNPAFFGFLTLLLIAPLLLSVNIFRPGRNGNSHWNVFDLIGDGTPTDTMLALLAGFVQESPTSREEQFKLVKRFIRQTTLGVSRENLWEDFKKHYESNLEVETLAEDLARSTGRDQQKYFLQVLVSLGYVDGNLADAEKNYVRQIVEHLAVTDSEVEAIFDQGKGRRQRRTNDRRRRNRRRRRHTTNGGGTSITDAYEILGVDPSASKKDVKKAYQRKVKQHHPDQYKGEDGDRAQRAEEKMAEINEAYETIKKRW